MRDHGFTEAVNFYPRPPRGGRPAGPPVASDRRGISIHALREEGDPVIPEQTAGYKISIHALREEGDSKCDGQMRI